MISTAAKFQTCAMKCRIDVSLVCTVTNHDVVHKIDLLKFIKLLDLEVRVSSYSIKSPSLHFFTINHRANAYDCMQCTHGARVSWLYSTLCIKLRFYNISSTEFINVCFPFHGLDELMMNIDSLVYLTEWNDLFEN